MDSSSSAYNCSFLSLYSRCISQRARTLFPPSAAPSCSHSMDSSLSAYNRSFLSLYSRCGSQGGPEALPPLHQAELLPLHHGHELVHLQPQLHLPLPTLSDNRQIR